MSWEISYFKNFVLINKIIFKMVLLSNNSRDDCQVGLSRILLLNWYFFIFSTKRFKVQIIPPLDMEILKKKKIVLMKRWGENKIQGLLNIVILSKGLMKLVVNKICDSLISIVRFFFGYIYSGIYIHGNQYCKRSNELP